LESQSKAAVINRTSGIQTGSAAKKIFLERRIHSFYDGQGGCFVRAFRRFFVARGAHRTGRVKPMLALVASVQSLSSFRFFLLRIIVEEGTGRNQQRTTKKRVRQHISQLVLEYLPTQT